MNEYKKLFGFTHVLMANADQGHKGGLSKFITGHWHVIRPHRYFSAIKTLSLYTAGGNAEGACGCTQTEGVREGGVLTPALKVCGYWVSCWATLIPSPSHFVILMVAMHTNILSFFLLIQKYMTDGLTQKTRMEQENNKLGLSIARLMIFQLSENIMKFALLLLK